MNTNFILNYCAVEFTLVTDKFMFIDGFILKRKRSIDKSIWLSVILITFVVIYADTSPAKVSITGNEVLLFLFKLLFNFEDLSKSRECTKNIFSGYASLFGGLLNNK